MSKTQTDLYTIQLSYFFLTRYGYRFVLTRDAGDEVWLSNSRDATYPIIRISKESIAESIADGERIQQIQRQIMAHTRRVGPILDIHFFGEAQNAENAGIEHIVINEDGINNMIIANYYPGIEDVLQVADNPDEEYQRYEKRIQSYRQNPSQIRGQERIKREVPLVTMTVGIICALVFIFVTYLQSISSWDVAAMYGGALAKTFIYGANEWFRLLTAGFLHIRLMHLFFNLLALFSFGPLCEKIFGRGKMAIILLVSIISSSMLALVTSGGTTLTMGLSGGIFGLFAAFIVYLVSSGLHRNPRVFSQYASVIIINIAVSFMPNVSGFGHLGGAIGGILMGIIMIDNSRWKTLKKNTIVAALAALVFMVYFMLVLDNKKTPVALGTDFAVIEFAREHNIDFYADYLEDVLGNYYKGLGVID